MMNAYPVRSGNAEGSVAALEFAAVERGFEQGARFGRQPLQRNRNNLMKLHI
jgi:hypothetical protein